MKAQEERLRAARRWLIAGWWVTLLVSVAADVGVLVLWLHVNNGVDFVGFILYGSGYIGTLHLTLMSSPPFRGAHFTRFRRCVLAPVNLFVSGIMVAMTTTLVDQLASKYTVPFSWVISVVLGVLTVSSVIGLTTVPNAPSEPLTLRDAKKIYRAGWFFFLTALGAVNVPTVVSIASSSAFGATAESLTIANVTGALSILSLVVIPSLMTIESHRTLKNLIGNDDPFTYILLYGVNFLAVVFSIYEIPAMTHIYVAAFALPQTVSIAITFLVSLLLVVLVITAALITLRSSGDVGDLELEHRKRLREQRAVRAAPPAVSKPVPAPSVAVPAAPTRSKKALAEERRRRREAAATVPGQEPSRAFIAALRSGTCVYCGSPAAEADHVRPIARGGWHHEDNLVSACSPCNVTKNSNLLIEWIREHPDKVLYGMMSSPKVLAAYACEFRELGQTPGIPYEPINSEDTHPEIDAKKAKQWRGHRRRLAKGKQPLPPSPIAAAWNAWTPETGIDPTYAARIAEQVAEFQKPATDSMYSVPVHTCTVQ